MSSVSRKCLNCGTWNEGESITCLVCDHIIDPETIRVNEHEQRRINRENKPPGWLDSVVNKLNRSENIFVKALVLTLRAAWFVYWVILSFIIWLVAATPG